LSRQLFLLVAAGGFKGVKTPCFSQVFFLFQGRDTTTTTTTTTTTRVGVLSLEVLDSLTVVYLYVVHP